MTHPYQKFEDTPIWKAIDSAIQKLEKNNDLALITSREHIIGFLTEAVSSASLSGLTPEEFDGLRNALNEACHGANPIEEWECHSLTGLTKPQLHHLLNKLNGKAEHRDNGDRTSASSQ